MECLKASTIMRHARTLELESVFPHNAPSGRLSARPRRFTFTHHASSTSSQCYYRCTGMGYTIQHLQWRHSSWKAFAGAVSLDEDPSSLSEGDQLRSTGELVAEDASEGLIPQQLGSDEEPSTLSKGDQLRSTGELVSEDASEGLIPQQLGSDEEPSTLSEGDQLRSTGELVPEDASEGLIPQQLGSDEEPSTLSEGDQLISTGELVPEDALEGLIPQQLGSDELRSLLADSERAKLLRKLSDANQYNRFLKRQLQTRDDALTKFKTELAVLELELQTLVGLADEVANSSAQLSSRKIKGKYVQSHLLSRLEAIHEKIREQIKDVGSLRFEEVTLYWVGMAECVQVMGSFDGWSRGEDMSPEYSGDFNRFSATLKLRPGRYEIKFLVDGEWHLSPEFPTVGEDLTKNNLLIVE